MLTHLVNAIKLFFIIINKQADKVLKFSPGKPFQTGLKFAGAYPRGEHGYEGDEGKKY
jgi:hypothetical protein